MNKECRYQAIICGVGQSLVFETSYGNNAKIDTEFADQELLYAMRQSQSFFARENLSQGQRLLFDEPEGYLTERQITEINGQGFTRCSTYLFERHPDYPKALLTRIGH